MSEPLKLYEKQLKEVEEWFINCYSTIVPKDFITPFPEFETLPNGIVNREYYGYYVHLTNKLDKCPMNPFPTSNPDINIMMSHPSYIFSRVTKPLTDLEEVRGLKKIHDIFNKVRGVSMIVKKKAIGTNSVGGEKSVKKTLLEERQTEILELFGKFYSINEVHKILIEEYQLHCNVILVENFRLKHLDRIKELQDEYLRDFSEIRLTHKKSRLEELNDLYIGRKTIYGITQSKDDYKLLLQTIEQIKKEVDGDFVVNGQINIDVEHTVNFHVQRELLKGLAIKDIILTRLSARLGINSNYLIHRLHTSYYSKFNGYGSELTNQEDIPQYPSQYVYDFNELLPRVQEKKNEAEQLKTIHLLPQNTIQQMGDVKDLFMNLVKKKKVELEQSKEQIENMDKKKQDGEFKK